jgi:myo-inositol-1(or 4)-monophosphatase
MKKNAKHELSAAIDAAVDAGAMIKKRLGRTGTIRYKGAINIVTEVDEKAEALIVGKLNKAFPDYGIIAEESAPERKGSGSWIIDPLDGTTNFAHGFPFFCVSIALEREGDVVLGVVYDPMHEELFTAVKGSGAYRNNQPIRVSEVDVIGKAFLATGFSYAFKTKKDNNLDHFRRFMMAAFAIRRAGAAALDLCYVACGRFDGFWELDLKPWDTAAATLIIREAGGITTNFDGSPHSNYSHKLVASNGLLHKRMLAILEQG